MEDISTSELYSAIRQELRDNGDDLDLADYLSEGEEDTTKLEPPIEFDSKFPETLFLTGIPKVNQAKYDKLMGVLSKVIDKSGPNEKHMPINPDTGLTDGFCLATFESKQAAVTAAEQLDGFRLDKQNTFKVVKFDDYDKIVNRSDDFVPERTLTSFKRSHFRDWLTDKKCREQLLLRYQTETEIYWHDTMVGMPVLQYGGEREKEKKGHIWCDWRVQWTPQGTYLATYHAQGVKLWSGDEFEAQVKLPHAGTKAVEFSPTEDYALLWNGASHMDSDVKSYALYHILTGRCMKYFKTPVMTPLGDVPGQPGGVPDFPHFLWSADGKMFAECSESRIIVRDTETFDLIKGPDGKPSPIKFDDLNTFQWSPKDNTIAAWTLEKDNNPARLVLLALPSRKELASRSRTQCEATMHWQSEGDYFCLLVTKLSKTKKKCETNCEIFKMRQKGVPVDTVNVKDTVRGFFWEARGNRFAVLTADEAGLKPKLLIFVVNEDKTEEIVNFPLPSNSFNNLFWAPDGQYFVIAGMGQGDLLFCGLNADHKLDVLYKDEHFMLTDVTWDPSSRYVITAVTQPHANESGAGYKYTMEAGYAIRTFQGRILNRAQKEKLYECYWRPHPPSLLTSDSQKNVRKNIKQFSKRYDAIDDQAKEAARNAFKRDREEKNSAFQDILERLNEWKSEKDEETGWGEATESFQEGLGWMQDDKAIEEQLDTTEEMIAG